MTAAGSVALHIVLLPDPKYRGDAATVAATSAGGTLGDGVGNAADLRRGCIGVIAMQGEFGGILISGLSKSSL